MNIFHRVFNSLKPLNRRELARSGHSFQTLECEIITI